jgi:alkaline phosphatase D
VQRSAVLGLSVAVIGALAFPATSGAAKAFTNGVAAGEVTSKSAKLWGQARNPDTLTAEVATDKRFTDVEKQKRAKARKSDDLTVQVTVKGLKPDEHYYYRFCDVQGEREKCSKKGQFDTAPKAGKAETIRFAYTGDTDGTRLPGAGAPFFGSFEVFKAMLSERNDFNIHLGDIIYSDSSVGGFPPALTVEQKWRKYEQTLQQKNLRKIRGAAGFYSHPDDHEWINDFSIPEDGQQLYQAGVNAFVDYMPVSFSSQSGFFRSFRWGANAELFFLDERTFRSAKVDTSCINPQTGQPDLAPTAPQNVRNAFAALIPSLASPVSQECKDAINDPSRTMLGEAQLNALLNDLQSSTARFKIVVNETPIQQFYGLPYDRWEGYAFERVRLLNELESRGIRNVVFVTTDTHAAFANVIRYRTLNGDVAPSNAPAEAPSDTPYQDFIIGPVATNPFWDEIAEVTGNPAAGGLISSLFFKPAPPNGVGMFCSQGSEFSYAEVEVSTANATISYKDQEGNTIRDVNGQPCGPYVIPAT